MSTNRNLDVLDAAELAVTEVDRLLAETPCAIGARQVRESVQSIGANIAEGFGRGPGADRGRFLRIARGSTDETIQHLKTNWNAGLLSDKTYWSHHHRLVAIGKMIASLLRHPDSNAPRKPNAGSRRP